MRDLVLVAEEAEGLMLPENPDDWTVLQFLWWLVGSWSCIGVVAMLYIALTSDRKNE